MPGINTGTLEVHNILTVDNTLGALFIGIVASAILFGVTNAQVFLYFHQCRRDPFVLKTLVTFLWLLDILHLALIGRTFYWYGVSHFANPVFLQYTTWSLTAQVVTTSISNLIIRAIFIERIWRLDMRNRWIAPVIAIPALLIFVIGLTYAGEAQKARTLDGYRTLSWMLYLGYACALLTDQSIALMNGLFLWRSRKDSQPMDIPNILVTYGVNTGVVSGLCSICIFLTYAIMPLNLVSAAFAFVLSKVYFNSLLASLNARSSPKTEVTPTVVNMTPGSGSRPRRSLHINALSNQHHLRPPHVHLSQAPTDALEPSSITINIETVTEQKVDQLMRDSGDSDYPHRSPAIM